MCACRWVSVCADDERRIERRGGHAQEVAVVHLGAAAAEALEEAPYKNGVLDTKLGQHPPECVRAHECRASLFLEVEGLEHLFQSWDRKIGLPRRIFDELPVFVYFLQSQILLVKTDGHGFHKLVALAVIALAHTQVIDARGRIECSRLSSVSLRASLAC